MGRINKILNNLGIIGLLSFGEKYANGNEI
jgi:hypothetical protein